MNSRLGNALSAFADTVGDPQAVGDPPGSPYVREGELWDKQPLFNRPVGIE